MAHEHHHAAPADHRRRLLLVVAITGVIVVAQLVGSVLTGSLALLTDTVHAVADLSGLVVALIAATLMLRPANDRRTWGFRRVEVIAALGQAVLLLVVGAYAVVEGVQRLFAPPEVPAGELLVFGVIGLAANLVGLVVLHGSREANLNLRAAFLEVLNDALGSLGVIVAAVVIWATGFQRADALAGLFIAALMDETSERKPHNTNTSSQYVLNAIKYIQFNYSHDISIDDVAKSVGVSRSHLYRVFMSNVGKSPIDYLTEYRINEACKLLQGGTLSIAEVAISVGFFDQFYFSRVFKRAKGVPPSKYIASQQAAAPDTPDTP